MDLKFDNPSPPNPFRFFNFWTKNNSFLSLVEDSWKGNVFGNPMKVLFTKLKRLKVVLKTFNKEQFGVIYIREGT